MKIAVTGATGYVGGRLIPQLLDEGHEVVALARQPAKLGEAPWRRRVDVRRADVLDAASLDGALEGCDAAFYLVHSMSRGRDFAELDRRAAANFSAAAARCRVERIIYLGGLGDGDELSPHLASRHEVGATLAAGEVPVTELRAAVIIGSGSVSFEMLRYLTEVLPVMVTPRWVETRSQPIAIRDVLAHLLAALNDLPGDHVYEIGGPDIVSYRDMMRTYAEVAGLPPRVILRVPFLTPRLSSLWVGLVTPLESAVARPLVDSLRNEVIVRDRTPPADWGVEPLTMRRAMELAIQHSSAHDVATRWTDAGSSPALPSHHDPEWSGGTLFTDHKQVETDADASSLFAAFARVGGDVGYYAHDWAWGVRGVIDSLVGGVGLRRGRRHPTRVGLHDTIDFWRVSDVGTGSHLQLAAEMRLPGEAWLEWRIEERGPRRILHQTALFRPRGLWGRLYWYLMLPFHHVIFRRMAAGIVQHAEGR